MTNLNISPYYDDFDEFKNYHQILFRPGYAVQARELTQIQSIIKNQIAKFGSHIFKQGSIVIPGNSFQELDVPYVKLQQVASNITDLNYFIGKTIRGKQSGVSAYVKAVSVATDTDPSTLYLSYMSGGIDTDGEPNGKLVFDSGEEIVIELSPTTVAALVLGQTVSESHVGFGTMAFVNAGVYYINGQFVSTQKQSTIMQKYDVNPSCRVMFKIVNSFIDETDDATLLDPAYGSYNFAAPGATRLKIELVLSVIPLSQPLTDDYVELMRYEDGVLQEHTNTPKYNELDKALAKRTFDESGNYVVSGLNIKLREHLRTESNGGLFVTGGDASKFIYEVSPGVAYFNGLQIENITTKRVAANKAREIIQREFTTKASWGSYILVQNLRGTALEIDGSDSTCVIMAGNVEIGEVSVLGIDYHDGPTSGLSTIYKVFVKNLNITATGKTIDDASSIRKTSYAPGDTDALADIVKAAKLQNVSNTLQAEIITHSGTEQKVQYFNQTEQIAYLTWAGTNPSAWPLSGAAISQTNGAVVVTARISNISVIFKQGQQSLIFKLPYSNVKQLKNQYNNVDLQYTGWKKIGNVSPTGATISGATIVPIETGTIAAIQQTGSISPNNYALNLDSTTISGPDAVIYSQVRKQNQIAKTKTIKTVVGDTIQIVGGMCTLEHSDIISLQQIIVNGVDVKKNYVMNSGQTDYDYDYGFIKQKLPMIGTVSAQISYTYFEHSAGDFFSVDSYPADYLIQNAPVYESTQNAEIFNLSDCIDFRKQKNVSSVVITPDTFIETSVQIYAPRYDQICINRQGDLTIISGAAQLTPIRPVIPQTVYALSTFLIPAYTSDLSVATETRLAVTRYTMEDLSNIVKRIDYIEQFSLLSATEREATNSPFIDASTGLDRFKTGYLVESMVDPFMVANAFQEEFTASITPGIGISAGVEEDVIELIPDNTNSIYDVDADQTTIITQTNSNYLSKSFFRTGGMLTRAYYETVFASVNVSSKIVNVNPFNIVTWVGQLQLVPQSDVWVEVIYLPDLNFQRTVTHWNNGTAQTVTVPMGPSA